MKVWELFWSYSGVILQKKCVGMKVWELFWNYSAEKMRWNDGLGVILNLFWSYSASESEPQRCSACNKKTLRFETCVRKKKSDDPRHVMSRHTVSIQCQLGPGWVRDAIV